MKSQSAFPFDASALPPLITPEKREFPFTPAHFRVISERVFAFSGIKLPEAKREMIYARLARRLRILNIKSFDDYVRYLQAEPAEWEHCTNALTTNVTAFYREPHHFNILGEHALASHSSPYRVWSAGCSTGEEPYTIAMSLLEAHPTLNFTVLATDLDSQVLITAQSATYPVQSINKLPPDRQRKFFLRGTGRFEGKAKLRREVTSKVEFQRLNLMNQEWPVAPGFDAIFCRNVMIYFDKPTQTRLLNRYASLLKPNGLFFAGHAESLLDSGKVFKLKGQTVYELASHVRSHQGNNTIITPHSVLTGSAHHDSTSKSNEYLDYPSQISPDSLQIRKTGDKQK